MVVRKEKQKQEEISPMTVQCTDWLTLLSSYIVFVPSSRKSHRNQDVKKNKKKKKKKKKKRKEKEAFITAAPSRWSRKKK